MSFVLAAALAAMSGHAHLPSIRALSLAAAPLILTAALETGVDPLVLGAVAWRESGYRPNARGARGEIGLMQIAPRGMGRALCADLDVRNPAANVLCGARILAAARAKCGPKAERYLTYYNRPANGCRASRYSRKVLAAFNRARYRQES